MNIKDVEHKHSVQLRCVDSDEILKAASEYAQENEFYNNYDDLKKAFVAAVEWYKAEQQPVEFVEINGDALLSEEHFVLTKRGLVMAKDLETGDKFIGISGESEIFKLWFDKMFVK